jgi:NTP pyrophosphatase (non-canonical NTP hydrolase)
MFYPDDEIIQWAKERGLFGQETTQEVRLEKLKEEFEELADAIKSNNRDETIDALGDMHVVMTQIAFAEYTDMEDCAWTAYHEIKNRTGKLVNGKFVKDGGKRC